MRKIILIIMLVWPYVAFSQSGAETPDKCEVLNKVVELISDKNYDELRISGTESKVQPDLFAYDCPFILNEFDNVWFLKTILMELHYIMFFILYQNMI